MIATQIRIGKGATVGACLKALEKGGQSGRLAQAKHIVEDLNFYPESAFRTDLELDGRGDWLEVLDADATLIVERLPFAVPFAQPGTFPLFPPALVRLARKLAVWRAS